MATHKITTSKEKICNSHGHYSHATSECDIIKHEKDSYDDKKKDNNHQ